MPALLPCSLVKKFVAGTLRGMTVQLVVALFLIEPLSAAPPQSEACNEALATVWGVVAPGSTFGLLKNIEAIPGVSSAKFDLLHALATIRIRPNAVVTDDQIRAAVKSASYTPKEIRRFLTCPDKEAVPR